ncbi:MAG: TolB-like 6-bladed beta-propeller domain-containing protein [Bacteroidales bacterium]|nr:TolB-like 6-bladed beta-propeller domain-containing protein [Bacteroidales bacterium]
MKKILLSIVVSIFIVLVSCKNDKVLLSSLFPDNEIYHLKELNYPEDSILKPDFIYSFGDFILLSEPKSDYLLSSYNIKTKELNRFITKGNGPEELLDVQQIGSFKNDNTFFAKSTFTENMFVFESVDNKIHKLSATPIPDNIVSLCTDGDLLIYSKYGDYRYSVYNNSNKSKIEFGDSIVYNNFSQNMISRTLQGLCTNSTEKKTIAWFSIYGDAYEIYDYSDLSDIKNTKQVLSWLPSVTAQREIPVMNTDTKLGVPSVTSSDKYIYALYSENTLMDAATLQDDVFFCKKILVFDWEGNPVKILQIDKELRSISFNKQQKIIYGIGKDENANLRIYYLDNIE